MCVHIHKQNYGLHAGVLYNIFPLYYMILALLVSYLPVLITILSIKSNSEKAVSFIGPLFLFD